MINCNNICILLSSTELIFFNISNIIINIIIINSILKLL